jgi:hypothetical protein
MEAPNVMGDKEDRNRWAAHPATMLVLIELINYVSCFVHFLSTLHGFRDLE